MAIVLASTGNRDRPKLFLGDRELALRVNCLEMASHSQGYESRNGARRRNFPLQEEKSLWGLIFMAMLHIVLVVSNFLQIKYGEEVLILLSSVLSSVSVKGIDF